jgi:hypothetical protein
MHCLAIRRRERISERANARVKKPQENFGNPGDNAYERVYDRSQDLDCHNDL